MSPQSKSDLSPVLELLNQARKDVGYEGEDPDFGDWTSEDLLRTIERAVHTAEDETDSVEDAAQNAQGAEEQSIQ